MSLNESVIEDTALTWLESLGYALKHGLNKSPAGDTLTLPSPNVRAEIWRLVGLVAKNATAQIDAMCRKCMLLWSGRTRVRTIRPIVDGNSCKKCNGSIVGRKWRL